jgi:hypothetical protein
MESVIRDVADAQKSLFSLQKTTLDVLRQQQAQIESLGRLQTLTRQMLDCIVKAVTEDDPGPGPSHLALNTEAMRKARQEILELERLFDREPEPEA